MPVYYKNGDICNADTDIIVNASNGTGYMGGKLGRLVRLKGVAESINYSTHGLVEREAKKAARRYKRIPSFIFGKESGECFITDSGGLKAKYIIHAVTMKRAGSLSNLCTIKKLLPVITEISRSLCCHTISLPILGTGTGRISVTQVLHEYEEFFSSVNDLDIFIYTYKKV